jgi:Tol biopolymer transport system component
MSTLTLITLAAALGTAALAPSGAGGNAAPSTRAAAPFEVDTHERMSWEALKRSANWGLFLDDMGLRDVIYSRTYPGRAHAAFRNLLVGDTHASGLVAAGAILEDTDPFFIVLKHFDDPINARGIRSPLAPTGHRRARDWAFDGGGSDNDWDWMSALDYFDAAMLGASAEVRMENQERLFVSLGHVIHLLQDGYQPGHTRLDVHIKPRLNVPSITTASPLEIWGRDNFSMIATAQALREPIKQGAPEYFPTFMEFFAEAGSVSNGEFFSEDTIFDDYDLPSTTTTRTRTEMGPDGTTKFVTSPVHSDPLDGRPTRLAREFRSSLPALFGPAYSFASPGDVVVEDQAQVLIPAAINASAGLLNHFFRGRFRISLDAQDQLELTNISEAGPAPAADLAFSSGRFTLAYETVDGTLIPLPPAFSPLPLPGRLDVGQKLTIPGVFATFLDGRRDVGLPESVRAREDGRVVAVFRGMIGQEEGVSASRGTFTFEDGGRVLFFKDIDPFGSGNLEIFSMNSRGRGVARLTHASTNDYSPSWSPDLSKVLFVSKANGDIWSMDANGDNPTNLINDARFQESDDEDPQWSPDGSRILFMRTRGVGGSGLGYWVHVMDADGSNRRRLVTDGDTAEENSPAWSPDGSRVAFSSFRDGNWEIYVVSVDGSGLTRLTEDEPCCGNRFDAHPEWSPDGSRIYFHTDRDTNSDFTHNFEIYSMDPGGSELTNLTRSPENEGRSTLSPDGTKIAVHRPVNGVHDIFVMSSTGADPVNVSTTPGEIDGPAIWSPDSSQIMFALYPDIFVVNIDGSELHSITNDGAGSYPTDWEE